MDACDICGGDGVCRAAVRVDITLPGGEPICAMAANIKSAISNSTGLAEQYIDIQTCVVDDGQATLTFQLLVANEDRRRRLQYGSLVLSLGAGVASAAGVDESALDTGTPQTLPLDCAGVAGGNATLDMCHICAGDNSFCSDCNNVLHGNATSDQCGNCDADTANDCAKDCHGIWGGTGTGDLCGICSGNNTCADCADVAHGEATQDHCGLCDTDLANDCTRDCDGVWAGSASVDMCGVCDGDNSTCLDCSGTPRGSSEVDQCGVCDHTTENDCVRDW